MHKCQLCNKEFKTKQGLNSHIGYHKNPNRKSNFSKYNQNVKNGKIQKTNSNQYTKAKNEGKVIIVTQETKNKISESRKGIKYTDEEKRNRSKSMKLAVKKHPLSYSANNVCGRTKIIEYNGKKLNGNWELLVAKWLDNNNIEWTNETNGFDYIWNNSNHIYFPDFYLPTLNLYIEVKGYERDRDRQKWKVVSNLIILKKNQIELIKNNKLDITFLKIV